MMSYLDTDTPEQNTQSETLQTGNSRNTTSALFLLLTIVSIDYSWCHLLVFICPGEDKSPSSGLRLQTNQNLEFLHENELQPLTINIIVIDHFYE